MNVSTVLKVARTILLGVLLGIVGTTEAAAQSSNTSARSTTAQTQSSDDPSPHSEGALEVGVSSVAPGKSVPAALRIDMEDGWHSYWKNPGDAGKPTNIRWDLPDGWTAEDIQWPVPHRIQAAGVASYGYSDVVRHPVRITPPDTLTPGTTVTLQGEARWLICADICLPAREKIERRLTVTGEAPNASDEADAIRTAQKQIPGPVDGWTVQATRSSGSYTLALTSETDRRPDLSDAYFYPAEKATLDHAAPQPVTQQGDTYLIALQESGYAQEPAERLQGVVVAPEGEHWDAAGEERAMTVDVPVDSTLEGIPDLAAQSSTAGGGGLSLPWALAFAFAGGLLLNLMPCVFPVLSVKILGFAEEAGEDDGPIRRHGLLFGAGVLVSMWVLAGVLLGLRAAGGQIGWGFQLQSPVFVGLMTLLFFGIGLNLLGVVEVGTRLMNWGGRLQSETPNSGNTGAFLTGVLATVVATPCTAPFMGAALGVALTLSTPGALFIFTALGVGMATPYVGLSMAPRWLDALPEPGAWMETLKQFFAFPMFATAIWLVWVFGQQTSTSGVALLLGALLLMSMAAWVVHRWAAPRLSRSLQMLTRGLAAVMVVGAVAATVIGAGYSRPSSAAASEPSDTSASTSAAAWQSFDPATVDSLRAQGRPVFVDFTAAWCLTCQVNKQNVLSSSTVTDAFATHDVALIRADWTNRNPTITKALESHGRSGVPVYALYPGDGSGPRLLPEVLTEDIVLGALDDLSNASS